MPEITIGMKNTPRRPVLNLIFPLRPTASARAIALTRTTVTTAKSNVNP